MSKPKQPAGPPMTLGNMREVGVQRLLISCLNHGCRHQAVLSADDYADDIAVARSSGGSKHHHSACYIDWHITMRIVEYSQSSTWG